MRVTDEIARATVICFSHENRCPSFCPLNNREKCPMEDRDGVSFFEADLANDLIEARAMIRKMREHIKIDDWSEEIVRESKEYAE